MKVVEGMQYWVERKTKLTGEVVNYICELIASEPRRLILKYEINQNYQVGNLALRPGMITYGFYWPERNYTLYKWFDQDGTLLGNYFNIADSVQFGDEEVSWRDLAVDILVYPDQTVEVLDEYEIPESVDTWVRIYIEATKQNLLRQVPAIIEETDRALQKVNEAI